MLYQMLGSSLLQADRAQSEYKPCRISTGCEAIDEALRGGLRTGRITAVSGERGTGKTLLALHVLVTHLLNNPNAQAAVIDTTGKFDVLRLHHIIVQRIKSKQAAERAAATSNVDPKIFYPDINPEGLESSASRVLDRVKVMRVFDFVGVREAIGELRDDIVKAKDDRDVRVALMDKQAPRWHVADSQAQEDDEDIMLFDGAGDENDEDAPVKSEPVGVIVVDNISSVVNRTLQSDYVQGQALLVPFMRSLSSLARDAGIAVILLNNAASSTSSYRNFPGLAQLNQSVDLPPSTFVASPQASSSTMISDLPSIFSSTTVQPSLGKSFSALVDCHLLMSTLPKCKKDADISIGGKPGKAELVNVIEVLNDKTEAMHARWAAFEIVDGGTQFKLP